MRTWANSPRCTDCTGCYTCAAPPTSDKRVTRLLLVPAKGVTLENSHFHSFVTQERKIVHDAFELLSRNHEFLKIPGIQRGRSFGRKKLIHAEFLEEQTCLSYVTDVPFHHDHANSNRNSMFDSDADATQRPLKGAIALRNFVVTRPLKGTDGGQYSINAEAT